MSDLKSQIKEVAETEIQVASPEDFKSEQDRISKAAEWKFKGVPVSKIADFFDVTVRTVYNWVNKHREVFVEEYENKTASELITEHLSFLDELERVLLYEASHIGQETLEYDPIKKKAVKVKGSFRDKRDLLSLVLQIRKQKIDLEVTTGVIPKEPEKIHTSISDYKFDPSDKDQDDSVADKSDEQVSAILDRLKKGIEW
jgi:transposase